MEPVDAPNSSDELAQRDGHRSTTVLEPEQSIPSETPPPAPESRGR